MDCIEVLKTRRSIRACTGEPVSREKIENSIDCGRLAPTGDQLLAAWAHGLSGCRVAGDKKPYANRIRSMAGTPEGFKLISLLSIGHPAEESVKDKRALAEVLHWGKHLKHRNDR
jgi:nitroreductase